LTLSPSEIEEYFKDLENTNKNLKNELVRLCWYMRGSLDYNTAFELGPEDRSMMADLVKENIENVKATKMPLL
jgi:hypothetical protein